MSKFYVISGILWNLRDISPNMIEKILDTKVLFVEFKSEIEKIFNMLNIKYKWLILELDYNFDDFSEDNKKIILSSLLRWDNIWIFEIWWTACFQDPWYRVIDFLYKLIDNNKCSLDIIPVPWTSALNTAISISGFNMDKFLFGWFLSENSKLEVINSKVPVVYFSEIQDSIDRTEGFLKFMDDIEDKKAFIWFNLWKNFDKKFIHYQNIILRGSYKDVFNSYKNKLSIKLNDINFKGNLEFVIIFNI